jgi:hypothetical protein
LALAAGAVLALLATVVCVFFLSWFHSFAVALVAVIITAASIALSRTSKYRKIAAARREVEQEYPSFVVQLTSSGRTVAE